MSLAAGRGGAGRGGRGRGCRQSQRLQLARRGLLRLIGVQRASRAQNVSHWPPAGQSTTYIVFPPGAPLTPTHRRTRCCAWLFRRSQDDYEVVRKVGRGKYSEVGGDSQRKHYQKVLAPSAYFYPAWYFLSMVQVQRGGWGQPKEVLESASSLRLFLPYSVFFVDGTSAAQRASRVERKGAAGGRGVRCSLLHPTFASIC